MIVYYINKQSLPQVVFIWFRLVSIRRRRRARTRIYSFYREYLNAIVNFEASDMCTRDISIY